MGPLSFFIFVCLLLKTLLFYHFKANNLGRVCVFDTLLDGLDSVIQGGAQGWCIFFYDPNETHQLPLKSHISNCATAKEIRVLTMFFFSVTRKPSTTNWIQFCVSTHMTYQKPVNLYFKASFSQICFICLNPFSVNTNFDVNLFGVQYT